MDPKLKSLLWQCIPSFFVSLLAFLFGLMVGWTSPSYPYLLQEDSVIPISLDQSAMIAGFLMIGVSVASPFANRHGFGTKYGLIICLILNLIGWIIVLFGNTIYNLLAGRLLIGIAFGYGQGQIKKYIGEFSEKNIKIINLKLFSLYSGFGITCANFIGIFVNYYNLVFICTLISASILILSLFLPHTPLEYVQFNKEKHAVTVLVNIKMRGNVFFDIEALKARKDIKNNEQTISSILKNVSLRKNFIILILLTFFQQFSGLPSTMVYCKIIFNEFALSYPEIYATVYALLYVIIQGVVIFSFLHINKKVLLLLSSIAVTVTLIAIIFVIFYDVYTQYPFVPVVLMYLFQFFHAIGLGSVIPFLIQDYFPISARNVIANYILIFHCMFALIVTKIFQVLYKNYAYEIPFTLFFAVAITSFIFITVFVPYRRVVVE